MSTKSGKQGGAGPYEAKKPAADAAYAEAAADCHAARIMAEAAHEALLAVGDFADALTRGPERPVPDAGYKAAADSRPVTQSLLRQAAMEIACSREGGDMPGKHEALLAVGDFADTLTRGPERLRQTPESGPFRHCPPVAGVSCPPEDQNPKDAADFRDGIVLRLQFTDPDTAKFSAPNARVEKTLYLFMPQAQLEQAERHALSCWQYGVTAGALRAYLIDELRLEPHRPRGPAIIEQYDDGSLITTCLRYGVRHAEGEPGRVVRHADGSVMEMDYRSGRIHGSNALRWFDAAGRQIRAADYEDGVKLAERALPEKKKRSPRRARKSAAKTAAP